MWLGCSILGLAELAEVIGDVIAMLATRCRFTNKTRNARFPSRQTGEFKQSGSGGTGSGRNVSVGREDRGQDKAVAPLSSTRTVDHINVLGLEPGGN